MRAYRRLTNLFRLLSRLGLVQTISTGKSDSVLLSVLSSGLLETPGALGFVPGLPPSMHALSRVQQATKLAETAQSNDMVELQLPGIRPEPQVMWQQYDFHTAEGLNGFWGRLEAACQFRYACYGLPGVTYCSH